MFLKSFKLALYFSWVSALVKKKLYDYIIIGGGSAASCLANRLSESSSNSVLVLEAGRRDSWWDLFIHMPAALSFPIGNKHYDWCYHSAPEPHMNGRRIFHARGKLLGGSSSINGMIFQRGNPMDYEKWAKDDGMKDWSYAHCLPYFKKMENCLSTGEPWHGKEGPLVLERGPGVNPLFKAFLSAAQQAGYDLTEDVNGYKQEGFALFDRNIHKGKRLSAARAYLHPVLHRKNLEVKTKATVHRILFDGRKACGVRIEEKPGKFSDVFAGQVVLCAGAMSSPQLLQLSGVGPKVLLEKLDIPIVHDLSGVGENLQDHLEVYVQYACKKPVSMNPKLKWWNHPLTGLQWLLFKKGAAATNHFEAGGFACSNDSIEYPNLMFHFLPLAVRYDGSQPEASHGYQVHIGPMYSNSKGYVRITSKDVHTHPEILFNYLSTEEDRSEWLEAVNIARKILNQPAFSEFNGGEISPGPGVKSKDEVLDWVRKDAETAIHPSGTCKLGVGSDAVVSPSDMGVHGVENLSVVDGSILPHITNGNIYAPIMMVAEKAADLILGNSPLTPQLTPFYRKESFEGSRRQQHFEESISGQDPEGVSGTV